MGEPYKKSATRDSFESLVVTVVLAVFGTTFVVQAFKIPTGSMENTLLIGDHLLVNKFAFEYCSDWFTRFLPYREIRRDDVAVFKYPGSGDQTEPGEHFVKRVIGLPGDRIRIVHRRLFRNGETVKEPFVLNTDPNQPRPGDDFPPTDYMPNTTAAWSEEMRNYIKDGELVVPPGRYFMMGDNREQSWDSRFWGFVPRELISGRPLLIYWSYETPRGEYLNTSLNDLLAQAVDLIIHFFTKTRWRRTFKFVG